MHRLGNHIRIDVYTRLPSLPIRMFGTKRKRDSAGESQLRARHDSEHLNKQKLQKKDRKKT